MEWGRSEYEQNAIELNKTEWNGVEANMNRIMWKRYSEIEIDEKR